ncbi:Tigger transposable element-derived protein 6 [Araneus ventricosus]|uniref:Tigger transposable element-derived protein 6 n=1 Tax=Araneus ventricosus TaxID=182803 RepID=A0A4Y2A3P8_ARAVE|nr:Tigger transposable element-derived protein 6 [Araneus ventricosus]
MKIRNSTYPEVEECVRKWFVQFRDQNLPVDASSCEEWLSELPSLLKDYKTDDVFNANETGLFFQCFPNKTAVFKGEECHSGKQSKLRVTVLLAANQSGKEKLPPLMIGQSKKPRCFANIKSFPIIYKSNQKAWMTSEIFGDWLKGIDKEMAKKKRRILLFKDNCNAHSNFPALKNITVKFLPPNATSKCQREIAGYREQIVRRLLDSIGEGKPCASINANG